MIPPIGFLRFAQPNGFNEFATTHMLQSWEFAP